MKRMRKVLRNVRDQRGFTLVELLMVMVIIGVLAGLGFVGMGMLQKRTLQVQADTNWRTLTSAVAMHEMETGDSAIPPDKLGDYINDDSKWFLVPAAEAAAATNADEAVGITRASVADGEPEKEVYYYITDDADVYVWNANSKMMIRSKNNPPVANIVVESP